MIFFLISSSFLGGGVDVIRLLLIFFYLVFDVSFSVGLRKGIKRI